MSDVTTCTWLTLALGVERFDLRHESKRVWALFIEIDTHHLLSMIEASLDAGRLQLDYALDAGLDVHYQPTGGL